MWFSSMCLTNILEFIGDTKSSNQTSFGIDQLVKEYIPVVSFQIHVMTMHLHTILKHTKVLAFHVVKVQLFWFCVSVLLFYLLLW